MLEIKRKEARYGTHIYDCRSFSKSGIESRHNPILREDPTASPICINILDAHKKQVESQLTEIHATLDILNYKLNHFQNIKTGKLIKN
ncbi:hypothetical protein ASD40_16280 [Paenibacillus sp. Root444D2]|nr:hypothetical protein ASD40_16280 [Paenibacillus sp. Root444D2]